MLLLSGSLLMLLACGGGGAPAGAPQAADELVPSLPDGRVGQPYSAPLLASSTSAPSLHLSKGSLPDGLELDGATIAGTPTRPGNWEFTIGVGFHPTAISKDYEIVVHASGGALAWGASQLAAGRSGSPYSGGLSVSGGKSPLAFRIDSGRLPSGMQMSGTTGALSGTPSESGAFKLSVTVEDDDNFELSRDFLLIVESSSVASLNVAMTPSRTTAVAPAAVFFDATTTTSSAVSNSFHHLHYFWDFGDPESRKNITRGACGAHVFDRVGSYTVRLVVMEPGGATRLLERQINVTSADAAFSGQNTICFSNDSDFTGAPSGAKRVQTSSFDDAMQEFGANKRLLFKRGDSFSCGNGHFLQGTNNSQIGAFGQGSNPNKRGIFANNPVLNCTTSPLRIKGNGYVFSDLRIVGPTSLNGPAFETSNGTMTQVLYHRVRTEGFLDGIVVNHQVVQYFGDPVHDHIFVNESEITGSRENGMYVGGSRLCVLGSLVERAELSHLVRITYLVGGVLEGNEFLWPGTGRQCLKLHKVYDTRYNDYTEKVVVLENDMRSDTNWPVTIAPQNGATDERVRDVLLESNQLVSTGTSFLGYYIAAQYITLRNNRIIKTGAANAFDAIYITRWGSEPVARGIEIYNNTFYDATSTGSYASLVCIDQHNGPVIVRGNLSYLPNASANFNHHRGSGTATAADNMSGQNPLFVNASGFDLRLGGSSPARGASSAGYPVLTDAEGGLRPAAPANPSVGAHQ